MNVAKWLDIKEAQGLDVSHIALPADLAYDEIPDETIFFQEIRTCSILCPENHPFAAVERFGNWYYAIGRDKENGPHTTKPLWWLFTRDEELAIKTAKEHIQTKS
ncbi:MAG: hypothetical protein AB2L12_09820 [Smithellaceae bacterium]